MSGSHPDSWSTSDVLRNGRTDAPIGKNRMIVAAQCRVNVLRRLKQAFRLAKLTKIGRRLGAVKEMAHTLDALTLRECTAKCRDSLAEQKLVNLRHDKIPACTPL